MVLTRQRQELLDLNTMIEVRSATTGKTRLDQLKVWIEVDDYNKVTGDIFTRMGVLHRKDLEFKKGTTW